MKEVDVQFFESNGYFVERSLYAPEEVAEVRDTFMQQKANEPVDGLSEMNPWQGVYSREDPLKFYPRMMHPHLHEDLPVGPLANRRRLDPLLHGFFRPSWGRSR